MHNRITRGGVQADTTAARNFVQLTHRSVPTWSRNRFEMKASERALHVSRLSDRINRLVCRKGLQERAVIGTVEIIIRALIRIYAAVGVLQVAPNQAETNLSTAQNKWISIDSGIKDSELIAH